MAISFTGVRIVSRTSKRVVRALKSLRMMRFVTLSIMGSFCHRFLLADILPPPAKDVVDYIDEEYDFDAKICHSNQSSRPVMKSGFQIFDRKFHSSMISQQWYLQIFRNCALRSFANSVQRIIANENVAWLPKHHHIANPHAAGYLANRMHTNGSPAANWRFWEWNALTTQLLKDLCVWWVTYWHWGEWMDVWQFGVFWRDFESLSGVVFILLLHW